MTPQARLLQAAVRPSTAVSFDERAWRELVDVAENGRVLPLLHRLAVAASSVPPGALPAADEAAISVASTCVRLELALLEVARRFEADDIRYAVLKGAATAHLDHPDPSFRQFGDIDVLVSPSDMQRATTLLEADGWRQSYALPPGHRSITHAVTFAKGDAELDLHQRVARRALGRLIATDDLLGSRRPLVLAGTTLWALGDVDRIVHAAIHHVGSRGSYRRLSTVCDVVVMTTSHVELAPEVIRRAEAWRVRPLVERAIRDAYDIAALPLPHEWAVEMSTPTTNRDRIVERAYLGDSRRLAWEEAAHLRRLGWRERAVYVSGHLLASARGVLRRA